MIKLSILEKKTIIFDIDETLVLSSYEPFDHEITANNLTTTIKVKNKNSMTRDGASTAYLCFRPYLLEMLIELYPYFEIVLFTVGKMEYAHAFCKAVNNMYWKSKYQNPNFFNNNSNS